MERGVYVSVAVAGLTRIRAVDSRGQEIRQALVPASQDVVKETQAMWAYLDAVNPPDDRLQLLSS